MPPRLASSIHPRLIHPSIHPSIGLCRRVSPRPSIHRVMPPRPAATRLDHSSVNPLGYAAATRLVHSSIGLCRRDTHRPTIHPYIGLCRRDPPRLASSIHPSRYPAATRLLQPSVSQVLQPRIGIAAATQARDSARKQKKIGKAERNEGTPLPISRRRPS